MAEGTGTIACLYTYVGEEANVDEVAKDLRNQAPTILVVCCCNGAMAEDMTTALSKDGVDKRTTRGDGEKGQGKGRARASPEDFQVQFECVKKADLIIAGRKGIVKEVEITDEAVTPVGGLVLIAQVGFSVSLQQMLSIRVAAISMPLVPEQGLMVAWDDVAVCLERRSVRLVAGEFTNKVLTFLKAMRNLLACRPCALDVAVQAGAHYLSSSQMFITGPVSQCTFCAEDKQGAPLWAPMSETRGCGVRLVEPVQDTWRSIKYTLECEVYLGQREDASRGWPIISRVNQKKVLTTLPHTKKLIAFMGGKETRRQPQSEAWRDTTRTARADKTAAHTKWAKRFRTKED